MQSRAREERKPGPNNQKKKTAKKQPEWETRRVRKREAREAHYYSKADDEDLDAKHAKHAWQYGREHVPRATVVDL